MSSLTEPASPSALTSSSHFLALGVDSSLPRCVFHGDTLPAQVRMRPSTDEKSIGRVLTGVSLPLASWPSSVTYIAAGTDSKWVTSKNFDPTCRSDEKSL